ncbi:MAG: hypothetical protein RIT45_2996 [Pseudomonadota bacterium]|jgi:hypothetical protein
MATHGIVQTAQITDTEVRQVLGTDADRQAVLFSPMPSTGEYTVSTERSFAHGAGLVVAAGACGVEITRERYGDAVTRPWFARSGSTGPVTIGFLVASGDGTPGVA